MSNFNFDLEDWVYDIESYPNLFTFVAWKLYDPTDKRVFVKYGERDDLDALREFLDDKNKRFTGHNNLYYDRAMLLTILKYDNIDEFALGRLTKTLIETDREDRRDIPDYYEMMYPKSLKWGMSLDTMAVSRVNRMNVSLKHAAVHLHHNKIQDLPIPPSQHIKPEQVDIVLSYNHNDVEIQEKLTRMLRPKFDVREFVSEKFNTDVSTSNDTAIGKAILENLIPEMTGIPLEELKNRTPPKRPHIWLGECIGKKIKFETPELQALLEYIRTITVYQYAKDAPYEVMDEENYDFFGNKNSINMVEETSNKDNYRLPKFINNPSDALKKILVMDHKTGQYLFKLRIDNMEYQMGVGGLHSVNLPEILETDDIYQHLELDFASFYPMLIWRNNFVPEQLPELLDVLIQIIKDRLEKKKLGGKGDKDAALYAQALKISINSLYGLLGSEYFIIHDMKSLLSVTITGQLALLMLIEKGLKKGFSVTGANTDGVNFCVPHNRMDELEEMRSQIENYFEIGLETTLYRKMVIRDVNNYIAVISSSYGDKVKLKGIFSTLFTNTRWTGRKEFYDMSLYNDHINGNNVDEKILNKNKEIPNFIKGFRHPVVAIMLYQYYIHGIDPEITVRNHDSIYDFAISQKSNTKKFQPTLVGINETGEHVEIPLQKTNRVIVTNSGFSLVKKHKLGGRDSKILASQSVRLINDVESENPKDYPLDYQFYIDEAYKIIRKIEPLEDFLF